MHKINRYQFITLITVSTLGFIMILSLFFWYKSFAYYTHAVYTYQTEYFLEDTYTGNHQIIKTLSRLKRYYQTFVINNSTKRITAEIYDHLDVNNSLPIMEPIVIESGNKYIFDSYNYNYIIVIYGEDVTEDNIIVEASTIQYLKEYRQSVIITMIIGIVMTGIWDLLILFVPKLVKNYGTKVNIGLMILSSVGSIFSCIVFYKGYLESNFCFISLFCAVFALSMKKREPYNTWKNKEVSTDEIYLAAGIISMFLSCLMLCIMFNSTDTSPLYIFNARNKMSLPDYAITVIVFLVLFLILSSLFLKNQKVVSFLKYYCKGNEFLICTPAVISTFFIQQKELGMSGSVGYSVLILIFFSILIYVYSYYKPKTKSHKNKALIIKSLFVYLLYILAIAAVTISTTVINYFHFEKDTFDNVYNMGWYYRPMYYVANNLSYAAENLTSYGHYPTIYKIFIDIFGANLLTVGIITGISGGVTTLFTIKILHILTKSTFLRIIGTFAIINILCSKLYIFIVPHRLLFPMIILFLITFLQKKELLWFHIILGLLISILSIVWNPESGAVVLLTWIAFLILKKASNKNFCIGYIIKSTVLALVITAGISIILIFFTLHYLNFSNPLKPATLTNIFGVLVDSEYMFSGHFNFIRWTNSPWIYIIMLFLGMTAYGISRIGFLGINRDTKHNMPAIISIAIMGLGLMVYFISRPEDYSIVMLPAIFLMIIILGSNRNLLHFTNSNSHDNTNNLKSIKRTLCLFLLLGFACIISKTGKAMEGVWSRAVDHHQLDYNLLLEDLDSFALEVPKNCYADGDGLPEIYMNLGWELPPENNTEYWVSDSFYNDEEHSFIKEIIFGDMRYYLYINNN